MIYLLDTNTISDWINLDYDVTSKIEEYLFRGDRLLLCQPVYYELRRGFLWRNNTRKISTLENKVLRVLELEPLITADWLQAAQFWAMTKSRGRQLSDVDLLLGALAHRLNATIASSDADFDALPVNRESWRDSPLTD